MQSQVMRIPGIRKSMYPDECGFTASEFVVAIREGYWDRMWFLLSAESRGLCQGRWAVLTNQPLSDVYEIGLGTNHQKFDEMAADFAANLIVDWGEDNLHQLGVIPTRYLDSRRARVLLAIGIEDPIVIDEPTAVPSIFVPMVHEDGHWRVHLPGFAWPERVEMVTTDVANQN